MGSFGQNPSNTKRLDSWKEIGAFFQRDERTVKRWEATRGLPVHRVPGGGRVYAYAHELTAWLESGGAKDAESQPTDTPKESVTGSAAAPMQAEPLDTVERRRKISPAFVTIVSVLLLGGLLLLVRPPWRRNTGDNHASAHKTDPKAQELYLTGIFYWHKRTPESLNRAVDYFTQAIVVDPNYAPAYVGLADCYNLLREYSSLPESEAYPRAIAAAKRAIALDDSLSGAHSSLAFAEFYWTWNYPEAEKEFRRAIELSPNAEQAHHWYATSLIEFGRFQEALAEIERARVLDPQSRSILADKGLILYLAGQKNEGMSILRNVEAADPEFLSSHVYLENIGLIEKQYPAYVTEARKVAELRHDADRMSVVAAAEQGLVKSGGHGLLTSRLSAQKKLHAQDKIPPYLLAETCGLLNDGDCVVNYLQECYDRHDPSILAMEVSPIFRQFHADPRFQALASKVGLPKLP